MIRKNNCLKYVGLFLIIISLLYFLNFIYQKRKDIKKTEEIINSLFPINTDDDIIININEKKQENIYATNNYLGYIELPDYSIKRLITSGVTKSNLDNGFVVTLNSSANLDDEYGNIILAGHSTSNVFQKLHDTKIGDQITIGTYQNIYNYIITERHVVKSDDLSFFKKVNDKKILTLVTCENDNDYRLIIVAKICSN